MPMTLLNNSNSLRNHLATSQWEGCFSAFLCTHALLSDITVFTPLLTISSSCWLVISPILWYFGSYCCAGTHCTNVQVLAIYWGLLQQHYYNMHDVHMLTLGSCCRLSKEVSCHFYAIDNVIDFISFCLMHRALICKKNSCREQIARLLHGCILIEIYYTHFAITSIPICSCVLVWLKGTTCKCLYMEECSIIYLDNPQAILCNHGH